MKVVLVVCNIRLESHRWGRLRLRWESTYREGLACIAGTLSRHGVEVSLLKVETGLGEAEFLALFERHFADCDVVGFTVNTVDFPEASRLAKVLKQARPGLTTVCGGVHSTLSPEESAQAPGFDVVCVGEGEEAMLELCRQLEDGRRPSGIAGLWLKGPGGIEKNPVAPLAAELCKLPPLRNLPTITSYDARSVSDLTFFMTTRGCPYRCTYCCNDTLRSVYPNPKAYYRQKTVDCVLEELKQQLGRASAGSFVSFYDDVMMADADWFEAFAKRYAEEIGRPTFLTGRWELLTERTVPLLKKLGCVFLLVGVEVGDEGLRRGLLNRNQSSAMMLERAALLRRHGIRYGLFTMVGLPTETIESARETVKLAARLRSNPLLGHHTIFYPFAGTPLHALCEREGLISAREVGSYFDDSRLDMPAFSRQAIMASHRRFNWFRIAYWLAWKLPRVLARWSESWLDWLWLWRVSKPG
jgi:radical SAM superfamily enzyme YgiQ (UPF0313 family)